MALLIVACSKKGKLNYTKSVVNGVEIFSNENRPADPDLTAEFKLEKTIKGIPDDESDSNRIFISPTNLDIDSKGNLYVFDNKTQSVKNFSSEGVFIKSFCRKGQGPGEVENGNDVMVNSDTIIVIAGNEFVKFDTEGQFLYKLNKKDAAFFLRIVKTGNKIVGLLNNIEIKENRLESIFETNLFLLNNSFRPISKSFYEVKTMLKDLYENPGESDWMSFYPFVASDSLLYLAITSKKEYKIKIFTHSAKHIATITKKCMPIQFTTAEKEPIIKRIENDNQMSKSFPNRKGNLIKFYTDKILINDILLDASGNIWVNRAYKMQNDSDLCIMFDIFKNNIYQNSIKFNPQIATKNTVESNINIKLMNNKIYVTDGEKAEIRIYNYQLKSSK